MRCAKQTWRRMSSVGSRAESHEWDRLVSTRSGFNVERARQAYCASHAAIPVHTTLFWGDPPPESDAAAVKRWCPAVDMHAVDELDAGRIEFLRHPSLTADELGYPAGEGAGAGGGGGFCARVKLGRDETGNWHRGEAFPCGHFNGVRVGRVLLDDREFTALHWTGAGGNYATLLAGVPAGVCLTQFLLERWRSTHEPDEVVGRAVHKEDPPALPAFLDALVVTVGLANASASWRRCMRAFPADWDAKSTLDLVHALVSSTDVWECFQPVLAALAMSMRNDTGATQIDVLTLRYSHLRTARLRFAALGVYGVADGDCLPQDAEAARDHAPDTCALSEGCVGMDAPLAWVHGGGRGVDIFRDTPEMWMSSPKRMRHQDAPTTQDPTDLYR